MQGDRMWRRALSCPSPARWTPEDPARSAGERELFSANEATALSRTGDVIDASAKWEPVPHPAPPAEGGRSHPPPFRLWDLPIFEVVSQVAGLEAFAASSEGDWPRGLVGPVSAPAPEPGDDQHMGPSRSAARRGRMVERLHADMAQSTVAIAEAIAGRGGAGGPDPDTS